MYSLLTPVRYLINPRFNLTTPLISGLFYLAPGAGFLLGTIGGGRWADLTVRRYIKKRSGTRVAEDRLHSGLVAFFLLLPAGTLIYGWCLEYVVGGLAVAIISIFCSCLGLMIAFSSLNTYCAGRWSTTIHVCPVAYVHAEVIPASKRDIMASKYLIQYTLCAAGTASITPLINSIGVGWALTISMLCHGNGVLFVKLTPTGVALVLIGGAFVVTVAQYGDREEKKSLVPSV